MINYTIIRNLILAVTLGGSVSWAQMTIVNGASFNPNGPMAAGSFVTAFGQNLCAHTAAGEWIGPGQLPTAIAGCSVTVNGVPAMMHYVSPGQMNFLVPMGAVAGIAHVRVHNGDQEIDGSMSIGPAGPGIFSMNGMGIGEGAMMHGTIWQAGPFSTTTGGQPTPVSIYVTGLDLSSKPMVKVGGVEVEVTWFGNAPGFAGLQQINITLPEHLAGVGMAPVTVTSSGVISNVTFMNILPTSSMMQGMPGWGSGMMVGENMSRGREMSYLAYNASNNTALVTDEADDVLRVISLDTFDTVQTITLPNGSEAHAVAVNAQGTMAAVALSHNASVALVNLLQPSDISIIGTGVYPSHLAFSPAGLLVTNAGSGTVTVIDTAIRSVITNLDVGFGPAGIAVAGTTAVVANMQGGTVSMIDLADYSVATVNLPLGTRPHDVAIESALNKAVITTPMSNDFLVLDLATGQFNSVQTSIWNAMGPGAAVTHGSRAYIANQMTASVTVVDLNTNAVLHTFPVDPGPRALAVDPARNRLLVLSHGTGVLSAIDLNSFAVVARANATDGDALGRWTLPAVTSISPSYARRGTAFVMTITGANLHDVDEIEFHIMGTGSSMGPGGGMGSGGGMASGGAMAGSSGAGPVSSSMMHHDESVGTSNLRVSEDGSTITVSVEIRSDAIPGVRRVGSETSHGEVIGGPVSNNWFTVTW